MNGDREKVDRNNDVSSDKNRWGHITNSRKSHGVWPFFVQPVKLHLQGLHGQETHNRLCNPKSWLTKNPPQLQWLQRIRLLHPKINENRKPEGGGEWEKYNGEVEGKGD